MSTAKLIIGIDLGTTNSLAAVMTEDGPRVLRDASGAVLIPSVVNFATSGKVTVGAAARSMLLEHPDRTVYSIKRLLGRSGKDLAAEADMLAYRVIPGARGLAKVAIDGAEHSPEQISALILAEVKAQASAALGQEVEDVVVTVPAYFDDAQRQATKDAAELAGLNCRRIINEPTAASLAYGIDGSRDGLILVYDLGGGTFDVSILRIQDGVFRVLATAGNTHLGGDDFDQKIAGRILAQLDLDKDSPSLRSPYIRQAIRQAAEGLKIELSEKQQATLKIDLREAGSLDFSITRSEFEELIEALIDETIACCQRALKDAQVDLSEIDDLVLVGGSTRTPLVRQRLEQLLGKPAHRGPEAGGIDPDLAVALGASVQAGILSGKTTDLLLLDVIPLSLGIETMGGVISKLLMRNSTVPASVTEEFSTQVDNQTAVDINIYQGEREKTDDCRMLAAFKLRGLPAMPAGLPRVAVTFLIDANGVLKVNATELRTGTEASIQVLPSFGLSRDEVRRMVTESIEQAIPDLQLREGIELRNKARSMVEGTKRAMELADLPADEVWSLRSAVDDLDRLMQSEAAGDQALNLAVDKLSGLSMQLADDMISSAVTKALKEEA